MAKSGEVNNLWRVFKHFAESSVPPVKTILSHYTSLDGFRCIIESDQLWASNVRFLNDRKEMEYGIEQSVKFLNSVEDNASGDYERTLISKAKSNISKSIPDIYACCFSEEKDSLSQWRGYTGQTQGIALDFDYSQLAAHFMGDDAVLSKVSYGADETAEILKRQLKNVVTPLGSPQPTIPLMLETLILELIPRFKHQSFKNEAEWRLVVSQPDNANIVFRTRDNVLVPYVKLGGNGRTLPIKAVRIGPGKDMEITRRSVDLFLKSKKDYENVSVEVSTVPFRS